MYVVVVVSLSVFGGTKVVLVDSLQSSSSDVVCVMVVCLEDEPSSLKKLASATSVKVVGLNFAKVACNLESSPSDDLLTFFAATLLPPIFFAEDFCNFANFSGSITIVNLLVSVMSKS